MSVFSQIVMAPRDPILGLNEQFASDSNPKKVNLGVGVYSDGNGKLPLLQCVREAEKRIFESAKPRGYLPIDGIASYDKLVCELAFGAHSEVVQSGRVATVQTLGGTSALRVGVDFLRRTCPEAKVYISDPSWENHRAIFSAAGFTVQSYPYYDPQRKSINFAAMLAAIMQAPKGSIFVLHACCHNPTGYDLSSTQWEQVIQALIAQEHTPFLDMAYQGFGQGLVEDSAVVDRLAQTQSPFLLATSFSKNFSLYGERVGALSMVCKTQEEAQRVLSQVKATIRSNYSNPPTHGAQIVALVLGSQELRQQWEVELGHMRERIHSVRQLFVKQLKAAGVSADIDFITMQQGMFSYSGLSTAQMQRLRSAFGVYGTDSGRICVAALNQGNIDYVAQSIAQVM